MDQLNYRKRRTAHEPRQIARIQGTPALCCGSRVRCRHSIATAALRIRRSANRKSNENLSNAWAHRRCTPIYSHLWSKSAKFVAGVECQFYGQKHGSLRGFFRILVRRMDKEESDPAGPDQLERLLETGR